MEPLRFFFSPSSSSFQASRVTLRDYAIGVKNQHKGLLTLGVMNGKEQFRTSKGPYSLAVTCITSKKKGDVQSSQ